MAAQPGNAARGRSWAAAILASLVSIANRRWMAVLALVGLCLLVYLPGVLRLPAVDRTEIVYAETSRDMVARSAWFDPRYGTSVHQFRPIGTYWAQGVSSLVATIIAGPDTARSITVYRLPGLIAVTLAVLAVYGLSAPLVGATTAFIAATLFAVAPLTVLVSQLAITEGLSLLPATIAMLCLLRIYAVPAEGQNETQPLALMFWTSLGVGILLNALLVPILVVTTLMALFVMDRDTAWLVRLRSVWGVVIALTIASPWLIVRWLQDGIPFAGMDVHALTDALGGSQDMKLRAFPGTFTLALLLGFLPGTALLGPALIRLWRSRDQRIARFLLAWVIGYLAYLELISTKPGTYTVQVMFPALALAVAMLVAAWTEARQSSAADPPAQAVLAWHAIPWPPLAAAFAILLFAGVYVAIGAGPSVAAIVLIMAVAALFFVSARDGRANDLTSWWASGVAALALFAVTLLGVVLPSLDAIWPARQIARTIAAACPGKPPATAGLLGFREPSGIFLLNAPSGLQSPEAIAQSRPPLRVVEARWLDRYNAALAAQSASPGTPLGCVTTLNAMRGCWLTFHIFADGLGNQCSPLGTAASCDSLASRMMPRDKACE